jgi:hypothetical protein
MAARAFRDELFDSMLGWSAVARPMELFATMVRGRLLGALDREPLPLGGLTTLMPHVLGKRGLPHVEGPSFKERGASVGSVDARLAWHSGVNTAKRLRLVR